MTTAIDERPICKAMLLIMDLAHKLGVRDINKLTACWEHEVDEHWWIACNAHKTPVECSHGVQVEPFECYAECNGWPAAKFNSFGGVIVSSWHQMEGGCENEFCAALEKAIKRLKHEKRTRNKASRRTALE